ncbi:MAG TPA: DUF4349 domain-containing protein [Anaerolineales bacterium]|nr:DUF4349 domain-containing protein [Anaerolineales bacterium]
MSRSKLLFSAALATALFLSACAAPQSVVQQPLVEEDKSWPVEPEMLTLSDAAARESYDGAVANTGSGVAGELYSEPAAAPAPQDSVGRLVIKNATLNLVVRDPQASIESITALAERLDGYVVSSQTYKQGYDAEGEAMLYGAISLRVPAERLNEALAELRAGAVRVDNESLSGDDVTSQYTDLQSQLRNLEAAEAQLTEIMEEAKRTEDVLNVYNQLVGIRGQIEQIKGQLKYYEESAALSLITLTLTPDLASQPIEPAAWAPQGVAKQAVEALVNTLQSLGTAAIWFGVYTLPLLLLFGLPIVAILFIVRRFTRRPRVVAPAPKQ